MYSRTELYYNSFIPKTIRLWNNMDNINKQCKTSDLLKLNLTKIVKQNRTPKYYNAGTRIGQIIHARLRMFCSNLNYHMYLRHLAEEQECQCGYKKEDAEHYLLQCPLYENSRKNFLPPNSNLELLLYGNINLNTASNNELFEKVSMYIIDTKRFN